jgi:outer membrane protein assembly factor BamB
MVRPVIQRCWLVLLATGGLALALYFTLTFLAGPESPPPAVRVVWTFEAVDRGAIITTPRVAGCRVYIGAIRDAGLAPAGAVYCLEEKTGREVWKFDDDGEMKHMVSSPCLADGRLYLGEGMHANPVCKFYCLDAATGRKLWHFAAEGHIESSPCVADGKVYFGAGDDGLFCLDAVTGKKRWHFRESVHVDTSPMVVGQRLYAGAGISLTCKTPEVFCLDADSGQALWRRPTDLPVWGSPQAAGRQVFFGLGNGRLDRSAEPPEKPAGALLCVKADSGQTSWRYPVRDAVMARPAVDREHVYFGARDGFCYCVARRGGKERWKKDLGSPVVTAPALVDRRLYVVPSAGRVCCLDADNGREDWAFDVARHSQTRPQLFSSPIVIPDQGGGRRIVFGAELRNPVSSAAVLYCLGD